MDISAKTILLSNLESAINHLSYLGGNLPPCWMMLDGRIEFDAELCKRLINDCRKFVNEELETMDKNDPWYLWKKSNSQDPKINENYTLEYIGHMEKIGSFNGEKWNIGIYG